MSFIRSSIILIFQVIIYAGAISAAPASPVSINLEALNAEPSFGDSLSFILTVTAPEDYLLSEPVLAGVKDDSEILSHWHNEKKTADGTIERQLGILTYAISPDSLIFGPVVMKYYSADGDSGIASSETLKLPVKSMIANPQQPSPALPDRAPMSIHPSGIPVWAWILIIIALALLAYYLFRRLRKKSGKTIEPTPVIVIDEIEEFKKIKAQNLPEQGQTKEHYILISDAMRSFLYRTLSFDAIYETSYEILLQLRKQQISDDEYRQISDIFSESDMVKFAKYTPSLDEAMRAVDRALIPVKSLLEKKRAREAAVEAKQKESLDKTAMLKTDEKPGGND